MKALTLWQPWAQLVAIGAKKIETRSWGTKYRGPIAIHSALTFLHKEQFEACDNPLIREALALDVQPRGFFGFLPFGCVVAITTLIACEKMTPELIAMVEEPERSFGWYEPDRYMWIFGDVIQEQPILAKGHQGIWTWELPESTPSELVTP